MRGRRLRQQSQRRWLRSRLCRGRHAPSPYVDFFGPCRPLNGTRLNSSTPRWSERLLTNTSSPLRSIAFRAASRAVAGFPSYVHGRTCDFGPTDTSLTSRSSSTSRGLDCLPRGAGFFKRSSTESGFPTLMALYVVIGVVYSDRASGSRRRPWVRRLPARPSSQQALCLGPTCGQTSAIL